MSRNYRFALSLASMGIVLILTTLVLQTFAYFEVNGSSMEPSLSSGDSVILKRADRAAKGEIVLFPMPDAWLRFNGNEAGHSLVKRVLAAPGDELRFDGRAFFVNGNVALSLNGAPCRSGSFTTRLSSNQLFVVGDNAGESLDSRFVLCMGDSTYLVSLNTVAAYGNVAKIF